MKEEEYIGFTDYLEGKKPYDFYISHAGALFHKGLRVRYAYKSITGINYVVARHNKYTSYNVYISFKLWRGLNENLLIFPIL